MRPANWRTLSDIDMSGEGPASQRVNFVSNEEGADQEMKMPAGWEPTGVEFDAGERRRGQGAAFMKTGENYNGEDTGMLLRPKKPPMQLDISGQGANLAALIGPYLNDYIAKIFDDRMQDALRNPPRMPASPSPEPAQPPPPPEDIDNLPVSSETK